MNLIVVTSTKQNIKFGYEGEDNVTKIIFPYDESWLEYGEGNFEVRILRCGDEVAYTATDVVDDRQAMTLTMTVTDIELSVRGRGEMQLCYVCPDSIKKSPIYQYTVNRSVDYKYAVDPPEGSIIASVEKSLSEIKNTTNRLSNSVISIESSINDVNSQIDNINNKISEFDEEIDSVGEVETKVDNLETSIESINGRINTAEGNINENTESISDLNESVTELENKKVTDLETSGGKSDSGKYLTVGTDGKIKATSLTIPPKITVDESLSTTSKNPVQNKVIKTELNNINSNIATCNTEISKINGSLDTLIDVIPTDTASGATASFSDGADNIPIKNLIVNIDAVQSGTGDPSPDNVRPISGWTGATLTCNNETINIDWTNEAGEVYGGSLDVTTGVLTVNRKAVTVSAITTVLAAYVKSDAIDGFATNSEIYPRIAFNSQPDLFCDKLMQAKANIWEWTGYANCFAVNSNQIHINISNELLGITDYTEEDRTTAKEKLNTWLAENPVTLTIPVTPVTYQLTAQEVKTILGENNIFADTGDVSVEYRADIKKYIDKVVATAVSALS